MELLLLFLFGSFLVGARAARRGREPRRLVLLAVCFVVGAAFLRLSVY
ncbi:MAG: hypothetical protein ACK5OX_17895 [Desertimonas sp.]